MESKPIVTLLAVTSIAMASQVALAGPITIDVTYQGSANFGNGSVGYYGGSVAPNPNSDTSLVGVAIGGDSFTSIDHTYDFSTSGQFVAWCVDIYHWMNGGTVTYLVDTETDLAAELTGLRPANSDGATRVAALLGLADEHYGSLVTAQDSAAFQLAIWAIAYGTPDASGRYHIGTTDSNFKVDAATATSTFGVEANDWLGSLGTDNAGYYRINYLNDGSAGYTQDIIVFTHSPNVIVENGIPEPATPALVALGLVGLGFSRRKQ